MASAFRTLEASLRDGPATPPSGVLKDGVVDVQPVTWRRQVNTIHSSEGGPVSESEREADRLRARVAELTAAMEIQSREAFEAGLREGNAEARRQMETDVRKRVEALAATIVTLADTRSEAIRRAEADVVRLAIEISRRVLHRELSVDGAALEPLIKAALEKLRGQELYRVRVHPDQERVVRSCLEQLGRGDSVEVVEDPVLSPGAAVFEMSRGSLDASVETQLNELERGLNDSLEARA